MDDEWIEFGIRLGAAAISGLLIGLERELRGKSAGLRTNALVAVGSGVFVIISLTFKNDPNVDLTRVIGQVVTGIGFLGAGTILHYKNNVKGLTTAATIWCSAAAGCLAALVMYEELAVFTGIVLVINYGFNFIEKIFGKKTKFRNHEKD